MPKLLRLLVPVLTAAAALAQTHAGISPFIHPADSEPGSVSDPSPSDPRTLAHSVLKQLIETNTTDSVGSTTAAATAMRDRFLAAGFPEQDLALVEPTPRRGNLVVRFRGPANARSKPVLIICHLDVVEARREDWTTDPFQLIEKDGYFYGRGTQDMKSSDAVLVSDLIRLKHDGFTPDRDIILALTAGEESGEANGVDYLTQHRRDLVDAAFVLNPDSGGIATENGKPVAVEVEATEKLYADFQLTSHNPGGHSSLPVPDNAIYHIADALAHLQHYQFPFELNPVTRVYFERMAAVEKGQAAEDMRAILKNPPALDAVELLSHDARFNSTMRTTCVATRLSGGHANNALPQTAGGIVNCRILPGHSAEEVRQDVMKIFADPAVTVRYVDSATDKLLDRAPDKKSLPPPPPLPAVFEPLQSVAAQMWPGAPIIPEMETGASDSVYTMAQGIPSYGVSGLAVDRNDVRAHGKDERIRITAFYDDLEFYYRYLKALTSGRQDPR